MTSSAVWPPLPPVLVVTGTGTGVGKTVTTAAFAAHALGEGLSVCVVKPVQTGVRTDPPDVGTVRALLGELAAQAGDRLRFEEYVRLPEPLAPQAAARLAGVSLPPVQRHAAVIASLVPEFDLVLVEGAGGLLVRLDDEGGTIADLARLIPGAQVVVVTEPGLGTLNSTELTTEALQRRDVPILGLVIGSWPAAPGPAETSNLTELPRLTGVRLLGVIPDRRAGVTGPPTLRS
jgi:dethiobiotin synthase